MNIEPLYSSHYKILDEFDLSDPKNLGRPFYFDLKLYIAAVEMMICSDEIERAFWMLDNPPAWWRENYPKELQDIKDTLYKNLYDQYQYAADEDEAGWSKEDVVQQFTSGYCFPRGEVLRDMIAHYNHEGKTPWVCELSPSHGPIPVGLQSLGLKFNFFGKNLNHAALVKLKEWLKEIWLDSPVDGQPKVFVCCESLEHAFDEESLYRSYSKLGIDFDEIVLSVPYGCMSGGLPNWHSRQIGHIRAYTTSDILALANRFFPGYKWKMYKHISMVLHGQRN